jgi:D-alanyl-D-alanine dipeptidase
MNHNSFLAIPVMLLLIAETFAQVKTVPPRPVEPNFAEARQAIVVTTQGWDSFKGQAQLFERKKVTSKWKRLGEPFAVVVGHNGLAMDSREAWRAETGGVAKSEGDGRAPAGLLPLTYAFGRPDKPGGIELPYTRLEEFTECVDDVNSSHYNKVVERMKVGNYDWKSSEKMLEVGDQYHIGVFVAYNSYPPVRGKGSCIFLHIWKDPESGTAGCTAMAREDLEKVVKWLDPKKNPHLIQMPEEAYQTYLKAWNLPNLR